jgi:hypothetical protein
MPYKVKGNCVYKKDTNAKVGCTKGDVDKYLAALHANVDESTNKLVGGKADEMTIKDIADKFNVPTSQIKNQIRKGLEVEKEHTKDTEKAKEVAMDHLTEFPDYYDKLDTMEKKASKELKLSQVTENTKSLIKRLIRENFNVINFDENYFKQRIPFLKEFKFYKRPNGVEAQKISFHENVKKMFNKEISIFPQFNVSSEFIYYIQPIDDNIFHHFILKNKMHAMQPQNMNDLEYKVFIMALKQLEEKNSYSYELMINKNNQIDTDELNNIINDINGKLFRFESITDDNNTSLF